MDNHHWMDMAEEAGQLQEAMVSRAAIEQAKGVLALLRGVDPDRGFAELRKTSMDGNVKIHAVAEALMAFVCGSDAEDGRSLQAADQLVHRTWADDLARVRQAVPPHGRADHRSARA